MTYDDDGRVVAQISQTGLTTRFGYAAGLRTTLSDASHTPISVYTHDEQGRVEMYATAGGLRFSRRFDEYGRVVEQHEPDGTSVAMTEHTDGRLRVEQFTSSTGQVERFAFDELDRLVHHTAEQGATTAEGTRFDYHGDTLYPRRLEVDGELGLAVDLAWEHGMPSRIVDSDGVADEFEVGADGTIATYRNALGDVTRFEYSPAGAISARHLPDGRVVGYERDDAGRLLAMVNPAGERGELTYTPAGRLLSTRDYDGAAITLEYDAAGLPTASSPRTARRPTSCSTTSSASSASGSPTATRSGSSATSSAARRPWTSTAAGGRSIATRPAAWSSSPTRQGSRPRPSTTRSASGRASPTPPVSAGSSSVG